MAAKKIHVCQLVSDHNLISEIQDEGAFGGAPRKGDEPGQPRPTTVLMLVMLERRREDELPRIFKLISPGHMTVSIKKEIKHLLID